MVEQMGFTSSAVNPASVIKTFSGGEKQGVAIVRALYFEADLIILDEPTMGLSLQETRKLIDFVREIKRGGQVGRFHRSQCFPCLFGGGSRGGAGSRHGRRRVPDQRYYAG